MDSPTQFELPSDMGVNTKYSEEHLEGRAFCTADLAFQVGAVVVNESGHVLAVQDPDTGALQLPVSRLSLHLGGLVRQPLRFVEEETGLKIERLPLRQADKRYRNPDVQRWEYLEEDLIFKDGSSRTTNPFSVGLDLVWYTEGASRSLRQAVVSWYGGVVRGQPELRPNQRFLPIRDLRLTMMNQQYPPDIHISALSLFESLSHAS